MSSDVDFSRLGGWAGVDRKVLEYALSTTDPWMMQPINIVGASMASRRMMLFEVTRKVLGSDTENYAQQIGDCTSFGTKNACEYLECCQIAMGNLGQFRKVFPPYIYGCERVYIGGGRINGDGGVGVWAAQACNQYGIIASDENSVPPYAGSVAKSWGNSDNGFKQFVPTGKQHLIGKTAKISTWEDLIQAITNLYPVTVCSDQGFSMLPGQDGFHNPQGSWAHCMAIIGVDDDGGNVEPHATILNSWGDVMGSITDFRDTSLKWPIGTLRVRKNVIEGMLRQDDSWAFSSFTDFPAQTLPANFFDMI